MIEAHFKPLEHWPRKFTLNRRRSQFESTYGQTLEKLKNELSKLGAKNIVIQVALDPRDIRLDGWPRANARRPEHPGVIVSFDSKHGPLSYMCDVFYDSLLGKVKVGGFVMTPEERKACLCKCKICGWLWFKRKPEDKPRVCPHCKNTNWSAGRQRAPNKK